MKKIGGFWSKDPSYPRKESVQIIPEHRVCKSDVQPRITTVLLSMPVVTVPSCGMSFRRDVRVSSQRERERKLRVTFLRSSMVAAAAGYRQFLSELRPTLKSSLFREILSQWKNMDRLPPPRRRRRWLRFLMLPNANGRFFYPFFPNKPGRRYLRDLCHGWPRVQFVCVRVRKVTMRRGIFEHAQPSIRPRARCNYFTALFCAWRTDE